MSALELITFYGSRGAKWIQVAEPLHGTWIPVWDTDPCLGHGSLCGTRIPAWDTDPHVEQGSQHGIQIPVW